MKVIKLIKKTDISMQNHREIQYLIPIAVLTVVFAFIFLLSMMKTTGGHPMMPLDDTFIHFQYAKRLSQGHFFSYTDGSGYSTGATSILYPIILAPLFIIGFTGVKIIIPAFFIGFLTLFLSAWGLYSLGRNLYNSNVGFGAAILLLLNGNILWSYFSGMETGLYALLIIWTTVFFSNFIITKNKRMFYASVLMMMLTSVTRPEAFPLILLSSIPIIMLKKNNLINIKDILFFAIALIPGIAYIIINKSLTGHISTNGLLVKGITANPYMTIWDQMKSVSETFLGIFSGYYDNIMGEKNFQEFQRRLLYPYFPQFILLFFIFGFFPGFISELKNKRAGIFIFGFIWFFLGITSTSLLMWSFVHHQRYHVPYQPLFFLFAVIGVYNISQIFPKNRISVFFGILSFLWLTSLPSVFFWAAEYGENASDIYNQHRRMSWYVKDCIPENEIVGTTDAGVLAYYGEHRIYDLVGLVTNNQAESFSNGTGSVYERLENLTAGERPGYIITYPYWFGEKSFLGPEVYKISLLGNTVTSGGYMTVHKQDWSLAGSGDVPYSIKNNPDWDGWKIVDFIDVADIESEKKHSYKNIQDSERIPLQPSPYAGNIFKKAAYEYKDSSGNLASVEIQDGGRLVTGNEVFTVKTNPKKETFIVFRTGADFDFELDLLIDKKYAGSLPVVASKSASGKFKEIHWSIPPECITQKESVFEVVYKWDHVGETPLSSFYYWILQKD